MKYAVAMGLLARQRTAVRTSVPAAQVAVRFGSAVLLNNDPTARPSYISWTPTKDDMDALDWNVSEADGTPVPPLTAEGVELGTDNPQPIPASGGTNTGTGWRRA